MEFRSNDGVAQRLVVPFGVIMDRELVNSTTQRRFTQNNHAVQALFLDAANKPLGEGVQIGRARGQANRFEPSTKKDAPKMFGVQNRSVVDQVFAAKITTDLVISYKIVKGITLSGGANNLFDVYPDRIFIDPRNDLSAVYANPVQGTNKTPGGYNSGRDASNRGRNLFGPNQFGFNGRFLFTRITIEVDQLGKQQKKHKKETNPAD